MTDRLDHLRGDHDLRIGLGPIVPHRRFEPLAALGGEGFIAPFLDLLRELGSDQVMVFAYAGDHASCLLSWNFTQSHLGSWLAADYLDGWYRQDPLCARVLAAKPGTVELRRLGDVLPLMRADYRERFFTRPGIERKDAVLAVGEARRLILNLYRYDEASVAPEPEALRFAGRLALLHFEALGAASYPPPPAALSDRDFAFLNDRAAVYDAGLVTTEKDWVRLTPDQRAAVAAWPVAARFEDEAGFTAFILRAL